MRSSAAKPRGTALHVRVAKSIALIDMFRNGSGLAADRATLAACIPDDTDGAIDAVAADLERWSVAVFRKHLDAWSIYAGSDLDIDGASSSAAAQASDLTSNRLARLAGLQPSQANATIVETGACAGFKQSLSIFAELAASRTVQAMPAGHFVLAIPSGG